MVIEVALKTLVGVVDAQLLEGVLLEVLKTKDIEDANVTDFLCRCAYLREGLVDTVNQVVKENRVDGLREGITGIT